MKAVARRQRRQGMKGEAKAAWRKRAGRSAARREGDCADGMGGGRRADGGQAVRGGVEQAVERHFARGASVARPVATPAANRIAAVVHKVIGGQATEASA